MPAARIGTEADAALARGSVDDVHVDREAHVGRGHAAEPLERLIPDLKDEICRRFPPITTVHSHGDAPSTRKHSTASQHGDDDGGERSSHRSEETNLRIQRAKRRWSTS